MRWQTASKSATLSDGNTVRGHTIRAYAKPTNTMHKHVPLPNPYEVALGLSPVEATFTYAAAGIVLSLIWKPRIGQDPASYIVQIHDVGFGDECRDDIDETSTDRFVGEMTTTEAAALMFIIANDDESSDQLPPEFLNRSYEVVEDWLSQNNVPNNLRPIP